MDPERIGPYEVLRLLGRGGMGSVYLALDDDGRTVAVKVIHPHIAENDGLLRLEREAEAMTRLRSPNVAEILDVDLRCATPYIVTRYVQGRSLDRIVADRGRSRAPR
jgi:serine/threonine protein kinase